MMTAAGSSAPKAGRRRRRTEKTMMSMSPSQKPGMAVPSEASSVLARSKRLLRLSEETIPSGMAMERPINEAMPASSQVAPRRSMTSSMAGRFAR